MLSCAKVWSSIISTWKMFPQMLAKIGLVMVRQWGSPNTSTPAQTIMQIVPIGIMGPGPLRRIVSPRCLLCYDLILSNIYTLLATSYSLLQLFRQLSYRQRVSICLVIHGSNPGCLQSWRRWLHETASLSPWPPPGPSPARWCSARGCCHSKYLHLGCHWTLL